MQVCQSRVRILSEYGCVRRLVPSEKIAYSIGISACILFFLYTTRRRVLEEILSRPNPVGHRACVALVVTAQY